MKLNQLFSISMVLFIASTLLLSLPSPVFATTISVSPDRGSVGSKITLSGEGFIGKLATIYWDDKKIKQNVPISKSGDINYAFQIPLATRGDHTIKVTDDSNWESIVATSSVEVTPNIVTEPGSAKKGINIMIFGYGFASNEPNIKVNFEGNSILQGPITADKSGSWNLSFSVPDMPNGEYSIQASGDITKQSEIQNVVFTIGPYCKATPLSGPVGTKITITGVGFRAGEDGVTFTWDGPIIDTNFVARPNGSFSYDIFAPQCVKGRHIIGIYGSSFTPKNIVPDIEFEVTPNIKITQSKLINSNDVTIEGFGFNESETITINLDGSNTGVTAVTNNKGSFNTVFQIISESNSQHTVNVSGNKGATASITLGIEREMLPTPKLLLPQSGTEIQALKSVLDVFGSVTDLISESIISGSTQKSSSPALVTLTWSEPTDQANMKYNLQVSTSNSFNALTLTQENIKETKYDIKRYMLPADHTYYWRVKAIDGYGRTSAWSNVQQFKVINTSTLIMVLSIIMLVLIVALLFFAIMLLLSRRQQ